MFVHLYASSWGKSNCLNSRSECQMFSLISSRHVGAHANGHQHGVSILSVAWNVLANNSRTVYRANLRIGHVVYLIIFYNISNYQLLWMNGFEFIFWWRDSENQQYQSVVLLVWQWGDIFIVNLKNLSLKNMTNHYALCSHVVNQSIYIVFTTLRFYNFLDPPCTPPLQSCFIRDADRPEI